MIELEQYWRSIAAERDCQNRPTQKRVQGECAHCGTEVIAYVWSLCGSGKRCPQCRSLLTVRTCFVDTVLGARTRTASRKELEAMYEPSTQDD